MKRPDFHLLGGLAPSVGPFQPEPELRRADLQGGGQARSRGVQVLTHPSGLDSLVDGKSV